MKKKKAAPKPRKKAVSKPRKKAAPKPRKKVKSKRSFGRKVFKGISEKENDKLRKLARDLAAAKAELKRIRAAQPKRKKPKVQPNQPTSLEKAKKLKHYKRNVRYLVNTNAQIETINQKLGDLNTQKIRIALSDAPNRLQQLSEIEERAIVYRKQRYRLQRPYFSQRLIQFRESHVNGEDSFITACRSIGMSEREAYTLWYSPK